MRPRRRRTPRLGVATLAWYAADPVACARNAGRAPDSAATRHGNRAHDALGARSWVSSVLRALVWLAALALAVLGLLVLVRPVFAGLDDDPMAMTWWAAGILGGLGVLLWFVYRWTATGEREIYERFGLSPRKYRLVATDLGGRPGLAVRDHELIGRPDAIFRRRRRWIFAEKVVGEFKSRRVGRNAVRDRERYQLTLYLGLVGGWSARGILAFGDGQTRTLQYDRELFRALKRLIPEARKALRDGQPPDPRPLRERQTS